MKSLLTCLVLTLPAVALAQKAVYRCESAGKASYSHEPCIGAREVDTTPTQGVDKMSGHSRKGADVQRREQNEAFATAIKPLTGMTPEQYRKFRHRNQLTPNDQRECVRLDAAIPVLKQQTASTPTADRAAVEVDLYKARKRFNDLNC